MLLLRDFLTLTLPLRLATLATISSILLRTSVAQTYAKCDPTQQSGCPADPALGGSTSIDFRKFRSGAGDGFTSIGYPTYDTNGISFTVAQSGDAPTIVSNWYIMFGKYEITMKAAPGRGIVSSVVLQSDDLDEIDWEWVGAQNDQAQTNYFGKGQTTTYDRGGTSSVSDSQNEFHTYGVEWTESQITWSIDGSTVRTLVADEADGQFPQTPCQLKIGVWSGGDPSNAEGTIRWAGGATDYSLGPYTMTVQSVSVVDYSTGSQYSYGDSSGEWKSIQASGGSVNGNAGGSFDNTPSHVVASGPSASASVFSLVNSTAPSQSQHPSSQPPVSQVASCSGASTSNDCQPTASSNLAARDAAIQQTTLKATATTSPKANRFHLKEGSKSKPVFLSAADHPSSGGSKTTARWAAGLGTLFSASIMAALLA